MQLYYKDDVSAVSLQTRAACTETTSTTTHLAELLEAPLSSKVLSVVYKDI
jgi:hypothetical protein